MTQKYLILSAAIAAVAAVASPGAQAQKATAAQKPGFYVGGAVGRMDANIDGGRLAAVGATVTAKDEKELGWKLFGGYQFNPYIGVEASYVDFGKFKFNGNIGATPFNSSLRVDGYGLALVGTMPLNDKVAFFGTAGGIWVKSRASASSPTVAAFQKDRSVETLIGGGVKYHFNPQFALRFEIDRYGISNSEYALFYSLGAQVNF